MVAPPMRTYTTTAYRAIIASSGKTGCIGRSLSPVHTSNNVEATGNTVEATFDFVEAIFDFVATNGNNVERLS